MPINLRKTFITFLLLLILVIFYATHQYELERIIFTKRWRQWDENSFNDFSSNSNRHQHETDSSFSVTLPSIAIIHGLDDEERVDINKETKYNVRTTTETPTTIVGGMIRKRIHGHGEVNPSYLSILSARIKRTNNSSSGWDSLSLLIAINTQNSSMNAKTAGCSSWNPTDIISKILLSWPDDNDDISSVVSNSNPPGVMFDKSSTLEIIGHSSDGWQQQRIWATKMKKLTGQICYGFIDFPLPNDVQHERRKGNKIRNALLNKRVKLNLKLSLIHDHHDLFGEVEEDNSIISFKNQHFITNNSISSFSIKESNSRLRTNQEQLLKQSLQIDFQLEARSNLARPHIAMCLDSLFGNITESAFEFLIYQKLIGVQKIFIFDETNQPETEKMLDWINRHQNEPGGHGGPFLQRLPFGVGQFVFGSPNPPADLGYGARELTMTYCAAESPSEPLNIGNFEHEHIDDVESKEDNEDWLFVDVGLDEFLDCKDLNYELNNTNKGIGYLIDLFANSAKLSEEKKTEKKSLINSIQEFGDNEHLTSSSSSSYSSQSSSQFSYHEKARCVDKKCIELCFMRYKFGSTLTPQYQPEGYQPDQLEDDHGDQSEVKESEYGLSQNTSVQLLKLERFKSTYIGHRQGKCLLRAGLALDLNLPIEVHGTLRQPNDEQCKRKNRNSQTNERKDRNGLKNKRKINHRAQYEIIIENQHPNQEVKQHGKRQLLHASSSSSSSSSLSLKDDDQEDEEPIHCRHGAPMRDTLRSPNFGPICRFNHYRSEFFTKCPQQEKTCHEYNGQRSVFIHSERVESTLFWSLPFLYEKKNQYMRRG